MYVVLVLVKLPRYQGNIHGFFNKEIVKPWAETAYKMILDPNNTPYLISAALSLLNTHLNVLPKEDRGTTFDQSVNLLGMSSEATSAALTLLNDHWEDVPEDLKPEIFAQSFKVLVNPKSNSYELSACLSFFDQCWEDVPEDRKLEIFEVACEGIDPSSGSAPAALNLFKNQWKDVLHFQRLLVWSKSVEISSNGQGDSRPSYAFTAACSLLKTVGNPTSRGASGKTKGAGQLPKSIGTRAVFGSTAYGSTAAGASLQSPTTVLMARPVRPEVASLEDQKSGPTPVPKPILHTPTVTQLPDRQVER